MAINIGTSNILMAIMFVIKYILAINIFMGKNHGILINGH